MFWLMFAGFNIAFMPMHFTGLRGMPRRVAVLNEEIERWAAANERVVVVPMNDVIAREYDDLDAAVPDGFHYTPHLHRVVGHELADVIEAWAAEQSHFEVDSP